MVKDNPVVHKKHSKITSENIEKFKKDVELANNPDGKTPLERAIEENNNTISFSSGDKKKIKWYIGLSVFFILAGIGAYIFLVPLKAGQKIPATMLEAKTQLSAVNIFKVRIDQNINDQINSIDYGTRSGVKEIIFTGITPETDKAEAQEYQIFSAQKVLELLNIKLPTNLAEDLDGRISTGVVTNNETENPYLILGIKNPNKSLKALLDNEALLQDYLKEIFTPAGGTFEDVLLKNIDARVNSNDPSAFIYGFPRIDVLLFTQGAESFNILADQIIVNGLKQYNTYN